MWAWELGHLPFGPFVLWARETLEVRSRPEDLSGGEVPGMGDELLEQVRASAPRGTSGKSLRASENSLTSAFRPGGSLEEKLEALVASAWSSHRGFDKAVIEVFRASQRHLETSREALRPGYEHKA